MPITCEPPEVVLHELYELVEALDRRTPHMERVGEDAIVHEAAALRSSALQRIAEIKALIEARETGL